MTRFRSASILLGMVGALFACDGSDDPLPPPAQSRTVFVSSVKYTGALGTLAGGDAKCQDLAAAAGLPGTFRAWLSDTAVSAAGRLSQSSVPYVRTDGVQVAASWSALVTPPLSRPINVDESGATLPADGGTFDTTAYVWTGTLPDGRGVGPSNCDNWTSDGGSEVKDSGIFGRANDVSQWTAADPVAALGCENSFRLYCFEQ